MSSKQKKKEITENFLERFSEFINLLIGIRESIPKKGAVNRNDFISLNANFIYAQALFERFLGNLLVYCIKNNRNIKQQYLYRFEEVIRKEIHKDKNSRWFAFRTPKAMIDNYPELEREKNQLVLAKELLDLNLKDKKINNIWKRCLEARERRNLLAHRGRKPDKIYYQNLEKSHSLSKKLIKDVMKKGMIYSLSTKREWNEEETKYFREKNSEENPVDLSVTPPYLSLQIINTIYLSYELLMSSGIKEIAELDALHEVLLYATKEKDVLLLSVCFAIFHRKSEKINKRDPRKLSIQEKVNMFICFLHLLDLDNSLKYKPLGELLLNSIKKEKHKHAEIVYSLLCSYRDKDKKEFIKNTKKFINQSKTGLEVYTWLIFQKYLRYKDFREAVELSLKAKKGKVKSEIEDTEKQLKKLKKKREEVLTKIKKSKVARIH